MHSGFIRDGLAVPGPGAKVPSPSCARPGTGGPQVPVQPRA